jgi:hypothetical protein
VFWWTVLVILAVVCLAAVVWDRRNRKRGRTFGNANPDVPMSDQQSPWRDFGSGDGGG